MVTVFCKSNKTHKISFFNWWHAHVIEVFARQIDELEMTSVSIYVSFLLESVERMNTVGIVDDDDLLAIWELSQEPPPLSWYLTSLNPRNVVRILKVLVIRLASVLLGDHYCIVLAWVSTVIDVSLSQ